MAYTKLFASIITSTIWMEDNDTRIVWITMLAASDKNGEVQASVPGLARIAGVSIAACQTALDKFLSPDPHSRTKDDEGRRVEVIPGGWALINHAKYRDLASRDESAASNAERQRRHRERQKRNGNSNAVTGNITHGLHIADADTKSDADSDADTKENKSKESKESSALPTPPIASPDEIHEPQWKPDERTKEAKLASIRTPKKYPSEIAFTAFVEGNELDGITCKRDNLYEDLCRSKWHHWTGRQWTKIKDWKAYVTAFNAKLESTESF